MSRSTETEAASLEAGILYVATMRDSYVEEAGRSAESVRRHCPELPIALFTDRPDHPLCARGGGSRSRSGLFDRVEAIIPTGLRMMPWAEGQLNKVRSLPRTPFVRTLHLDTDTIVLSSHLASLFARLDRCEVGMVEATIHDSFSRDELRRRMFNTGVILYRRTERVWRCLDEWAARSERNFRLAVRKRLPPMPFIDHVSNEDVRRALLCNDQVSLTEFLSPEINALGVALDMLEPIWNFRGPELHDANGNAVMVRHLRIPNGDAAAIEATPARA